MAQKSHHIFIAVFTDPCDTAKQVLQGWIHLRLPSCRPGFESHPHHLCFYNLLYNFWYICYVKRTKINKKRRVWSLFSKFYSTDPERERERESQRMWAVICGQFFSDSLCFGFFWSGTYFYFLWAQSGHHRCGNGILYYLPIYLQGVKNAFWHFLARKISIL